ncbi:aminoglycoside phosphotransferase family protein [Rhizobium sp. PDO1-076]|uniref:aminoglycoside phosphotransferase family protein n=1 Tax=Rhizobium sp. PDO1-076 TaxID=1125979 RepID=UPI000566E270|nr:aminoglycoside phosphotransferase family protein [Rhizobium sp. PDO1-076]
MSDRLDISEPLVRALIADQFPQWAALPVRKVVPGGWDNQTFRLGETMSVRLPSAGSYAAQVAKEQQILPVLAPQLSLPIPTALAKGQASSHYPFAFGIYGWITGEPAMAAQIADMTGFADRLAGFIQSLHRAETAGGPPAGPHNFHRGGDLGIYSAETVAAIAELADEIDGNVATAIWNEALSSHWVRPPVWVHGDIAPGNLLVADGQLVAVIDFGTAAIGDPACDLVIAWNFLHGEARARFRTALPLDDTTWQRARGWALWKALITTVDMRRSGAPALDGQRRILAVILSEKL